MFVRNFFVFIFLFAARVGRPSAITYHLAGGRLGDQLINYVHAKWISYKYGIPLFYKPFAYSNYFACDKLERRVPVDLRFDHVLEFRRGSALKIDPDANILYELSFFPDNPDERARNRGGFTFDVDWRDQAFCKLMRACLQPTKRLNLVEPVLGTINVALHIRRGGGFDHTASSVGHGQYRSDLVHPARFPPDDFFCEQVVHLMIYFAPRRLNFFIFTDHPDPKELVALYAARCPGAKFRCRSSGGHNVGVVDDLFSMARFDVIVRPQSNFSLMAAHIGDPLLEIWPEGCSFSGEKWMCTRVALFLRHLSKTVYRWSNMPESSVFLDSYQRRLA